MIEEALSLYTNVRKYWKDPKNISSRNKMAPILLVTSALTHVLTNIIRKMKARGEFPLKDVTVSEAWVNPEQTRCRSEMVMT